MKSFTTPDFWKTYAILPTSVKEQARKAYQIWQQNPFHPSLHFKKVGNNLWSARITRNYRALGSPIFRIPNPESRIPNPNSGGQLVGSGGLFTRLFTNFGIIATAHPTILYCTQITPSLKKVVPGGGQWLIIYSPLLANFGIIATAHPTINNLPIPDSRFPIPDSPHNKTYEKTY